MKIRKLALLMTLVSSSFVQADTLQEAVQKAIEHSPILKQNYNRLQRFESNTDAMRADYYPTVVLRGGYGIEQTEYTGGVYKHEKLNRGELGLTIRQSLFSGLRTVNDVNRLSEEEKSEYFRLMSKSEQIAIEAVQAYIQLHMAKKILEVAEKNQKEHERIKRIVENKTNNRLVPSSDLSQINARLASARSSTVAARNRLLEMYSRYSALVGSAPNETYDPDVSQVEIPASLEAAVAEAISNNNHIHAAEAQIEAARFELKTARSNFSPEVYLELSASNNNNVDGISGRDEDYQVMLRAEWELFSGGRDLSRQKASAYKIDEAKNARLDVEDQIRRTVEIAWNNYFLLNEQLNHLSENLKNSRDAEEGYQSQYDVGRRDLLSLLIVKTETFSVERSLIESQYNSLQAKLELKYNIGNFLKSMRTVTPGEWKRD